MFRNPVLFFVFAYILFVLSAQQYVNAASDVRKKRSDDTNPLTSVVENLSQQVTLLRSQLTALDVKISALQKNVAFHAEFSKDPMNIGPLAPLIMDKAITNTGSGYDTHTGNFHVPVSGSYMIVANCMALWNADLYVSLMVDEMLMGETVSDGTSHSWDHVSATLAAHLEKGQRVWLRNSQKQTKSARGLHYSTFSGFLIRADP